MQFGVYDRRRKAAKAVLTYVRAAPLASRWLAVRLPSGMEEPAGELLDYMREQSVFAAALSPAWLEPKPDGGILVRRDGEELIRALAGYYRCRLVPMAELGAKLPGAPEAQRRLAEALADAARGLRADALNVRLDAVAAVRPEGVFFLARLRERLAQDGIELWLTADSDLPQAATAGTLRPVAAPVPGIEILEPAARINGTAAR